uniref:Uncharacterized protein n=1 Tax=Manihot esculenta TaxID=3983 RepID=A0A2C9WC39_MANES
MLPKLIKYFRTILGTRFGFNNSSFMSFHAFISIFSISLYAPSFDIPCSLLHM